ncbi:MAG TPA: fibrinogen-like YCDxxxxGGGW domain-containing protein, partial [Myxococcota bacterium]|nr:fibrinogen-like YCDxxxxGGGW domain-containing protein [Myxococcota bacterium]
PEPLEAGATPAGTTYPYIVWSRALTNAASGLACTRHPVDAPAPNDGVSTSYATPALPQTFDFAYGPSVVPTLCTAGQTTCTLESCQDLIDAGLSAVTGTYALDPDGPSAGANAVDVWCDMPSATMLRLGTSANASWTSISAACPAGWVPYAIDAFERVAIAQAFAAAQASDWYWLNFFAGPDTNVGGALENQLGWISSTAPLTWTSSGFVDGGATALPNLDISGNQNQGFHDPIALSRTLGFANRAGSGLIYNSAEQTLMAPVVCTWTGP